MPKERTENQRAADMARRFETLAKHAREKSLNMAYRPKYREFERGFAVAFEQAAEMMRRTF